MSYPPGPKLKRSKYRVLGLIGQGQFGQVFCAIDRQTGQLVALKNLEHERFPTHKFLRELRFLLSFQHPNIVSCQALEHTSTGRYLVMDYCEGGTLRNLMAEENRLGLVYSLRIVADVLAGLDHAHSRGIVHCDIKPENILVHVRSNGWTARISDFGIARLSQEIIRQHSNTGSPAYMAPERFYGQYSAASDLYSVGIMLFELIAGYRPFSGTPAELMSAHLNAQLRMPDTIPAAWQLFIARSLQKLPARRFRSAGEMLAVMQEVATTELSEAWVNLPAEQTPLFYSIVSPPECLFQSLHQEPLTQPIGSLATSIQEPISQTKQPSSYILVKASDHQLSCLVDQTGSLFEADTKMANSTSWRRPIATSERIEQLLIRFQGCFVVTQRSVKLLSFESEGRTDLQPIAQLERESVVAIDPQGHWLASLSVPDVAHDTRLALWRLPSQQHFALPAAMALEQPSTLTDRLSLLALDSRHLAIITTQSPSVVEASRRLDIETTVKVLTRRGTHFGTLHLPLHLQQIALTPRPYRLVATEANHAGTVLLIDLKPYRIKRLWVEITPTFLAATNWGYILAEPEGRIVFVDHEGRQIGATHCPSPITAIAIVEQHGLLVATWKSGQGQLYSLDLRSLGLDLIF